MTERAEPLRALMLVVLGLAIVLLPFPALLAYETADPLSTDAARLFLPDIPIALVTILAAVAVARAGRRAVPGPIGIALVTLAMLALSLAAHPSAYGAELVLRFAGGLGIATAIANVARGDERLLVAALGVSAALQTFLGIAQAVAGTPLGLTPLGEISDPIYRVGGAPAPRGTMHHNYVLSALGFVAAGGCIAMARDARRRAPWIAAAALAVVPVGMSYSRNALLALGIGVAALAPGAVRGSRVHRLALAALVVGAGLPALVEHDGWAARTEATVSFRTDRPQLIAQALPIIAEHPLLGVGPGSYYDALDDLERRSPGTVRVRQVPHSVPVLLAAVAGIVAGAAMLAAIAYAGWRALRAGGVAIASFGMFAPFVLNEQFPYMFAQGGPLLGIWLGLLTVLSRGADT